MASTAIESHTTRMVVQIPSRPSSRGFIISFSKVTAHQRLAAIHDGAVERVRDVRNVDHHGVTRERFGAALGDEGLIDEHGDDVLGEIEAEAKSTDMLEQCAKLSEPAGVAYRLNKDEIIQIYKMAK